MISMLPSLLVLLRSSCPPSSHVRQRRGGECTWSLRARARRADSSWWLSRRGAGTGRREPALVSRWAAGLPRSWERRGEERARGLEMERERSGAEERGWRGGRGRGNRGEERKLTDLLLLDDEYSLLVVRREMCACCINSCDRCNAPVTVFNGAVTTLCARGWKTTWKISNLKAGFALQAARCTRAPRRCRWAPLQRPANPRGLRS